MTDDAQLTDDARKTHVLLLDVRHAVEMAMFNIGHAVLASALFIGGVLCLLIGDGFFTIIAGYGMFGLGLGRGIAISRSLDDD